MDNFAIRAANFRCFGSEPEGFDALKPINLIIGRNSSGKSSLIELIAYATLPNFAITQSNWHGGQAAAIFTETRLNERELREVIPDNQAGGRIAGPHVALRARLLGASVSVQLVPDANRLLSLSAHSGIRLEDIGDYGTSLANRPERNLLRKCVLRRLEAERHLAPEGENPDLEIQGDGRGATNLIQAIINRSDLRSELVEVELLRALNAVFAPDATFQRILCQRHSNGAWEIYVDEAGKGRIPLSQSGSGLKTVILALSFVHLLPAVGNTPVERYIFAFEELENNLHPALQRRLFRYLADQAVEKGFPLFLTTHSSVVIDMFSKDTNAQILHVTHEQGRSRVKTVQAYIEHRGVLDDLDVRASDLLQANGVIWVEGPSDRIYVNRWIELWSDGKLKEGTHYQCIFYGGRLLAHLSAQEPNSVEEGVAILAVNRNALVLIDSDRRAEGTPLNATKQRIAAEVTAVGGLVWVTAGREVENYIPWEVAATLLKTKVKPEGQPDRYESCFDWMDSLAADAGAGYALKKPMLAERVSPLLTRDSLERVLDLAARMAEVCQLIRRWNSIPEPGPTTG